VMWEGASLWIVDATPPASAEPRRTDFHAHHAIQVTISLGGVFGLRTAATSMQGEAVAVAADAGHDFEAEGLIAFLFVEPEGRLGRAISKRLFDKGELAAVPLDLLGDFPARAKTAFRAGGRNEATLVEIGRRLASALAANVAGEAPDLRVRKMIAWAS